MLFCNIDHLDSRLLPQTRKAGYQFFLAASSLDMLFAYMEYGAHIDTGLQQDITSELEEQALLASHHAAVAAQGLSSAKDQYLDLASTIGQNYRHINRENREHDVYRDAAAHVGLSAN